VKEVVAAVEQVTGLKVPAIIGPRRDGDPPALVADSTRLQTELGWKPQHSDLTTIVRTAWLWENRK
jgi:UDP-glucose 4-epimerase